MITPRRRSRVLAAALSLVMLALALPARGETPPLQVGSEPAYPPFAMVTSDGLPEGFSVDLMRAVATALNREARFRVAPWATLQADLAAGTLDILPLVAITPDRERIFDFTVPHTRLYAAVFAGPDSPDYDDLASLAGRRVAVMAGDWTQEWLATHAPAPTLVTTPTVPEALDLLARGQVDFVVATRLVGLLILRDLGLADVALVGVPPDQTGLPVAMAVPKGRDALRQKLDLALAVVAADGTYDILADRWFGPLLPEPDRRRTVILVVAGIAVGAGLLLIGAAAWLWALRRTVARRTAALADSQQRLALIIQGAREGIWEWNLATDQVWASSRWAEILDYPAEEMHFPVHWFFDQVHPEDRAMVRAAVDDHLDRRAPLQIECRLRTADRGFRWIAACAQAEWDGAGRPRRMVGAMSDISDRKSAEDRLKGFRRIIDSSLDPIYVCDITDGRFTDVNKAACRALGYDRETLLAMAVPDIDAGGQAPDREGLAAFVAHVRQEGGLTFESRHRRRDGSTYPVEISVQEVVLEGVPRMVGFVRDISQRKRDEQTLRDQNALFRSLIDNMPGLFYLFDQEGAMVQWNRRLEAVTGYTAGEMADRHPLDLVTDRDRERAAAEIERVLTTGRGSLEADLRRRDGTSVPYFFAAGRLELEGHVHIVGVGLDISARRAAEQARDRFFDLTLDLACVTDAGGRILRVNHRWTETLGWSADALTTRSLPDLIHDADRDAMTAALAHLDDGEPVAGLRTRCRHQDGGWRWLDWSLAPAGEMVLAIARDVTVREDQEQRLRETTAELQRSNEDLQQFAYVASHDLQEPLRMVTAYLNLIQRRYDDCLDKDGREFIDYAVDGAARMQVLIQDLLTFSRVASRDSQPETVDTGQVIQEVLANLRAGIAESAARIEIADLPPVQGDRSQISRLFQNLIANALKYRHPDRLPHIQIRAEPADDHQWRFMVTDNGIGLPTKEQDKVFQVFYRVQGRGGGAGTGLGLAICARIAAQHGGRIWVESAPDQGSTFFVTLPANEGDPTPPPESL